MVTRENADGVTVRAILLLALVSGAGTSYLGQDARAAHDSLGVVDAVVGSQRFHTVLPGEYLGEIAEQYGVGVLDLVLVNGLQDRDQITAGTVLQIPEGN